MHKLLASWYIQIYSNLYSADPVSTKLTLYSDAIDRSFSGSSLITQAYQIFLTVAIGLMLFYFVLSWGTSVMSKEATVTTFFISGLKLFVGYCLALKGFDIVHWMFQMGEELGDLIIGESDVVVFSPELEIALANGIKKIDIMSQIGYVFKALIPILLCLMADLVIVYVIVSRVLRIYVCAAMSPIALANTFDDTRRSDAVRFLKRTLAMALQCSMIIVVVLSVGIISNYMGNSNMNDPAEALFGSIVEDGEEISKVETEMEIQYGDKPNHKKEAFEKKIYQIDENGNFVKDEEGKRVLNPSYQKFSNKETKNFLDGILSKGNYWILICMLFIKMGLIKKSLSMCNTIVGL